MSNYTNFPSGITSMGVPIFGNGIPATKGNIFFVDYGSGNDANDGSTPATAFKTLDKANTAVTTNNYDVVCLIGSAEHVLTTMLDVSKNRVTFIGLDGSPGRRYGQRCRVTLGDSTTAADIATLKVTGVGCVFNNIKFSNTSVVAANLYCVADGGEYTQFISCEMYKSTDLTETGAADLLCNGDSSEYINCKIGDTVNAIVGAIIRPCVLLTREVITGKVARDVSFRNCLFARKCGHADNNFIYGANATAVERMLLIENCVFWNTKLGTTPDEAIEFASNQTQGTVFIKDSYAINVTGIASTGQGVYGINAAGATTSGIALALT
jgi:hypothetical protein